MMEYLAGLNFLEKIYLVCALFGGGFFILRTILMFAGIGDTDTDIDVDTDVDTDAGHADHDSDRMDDIDHGDHGEHGGLKLLTLQGITAFIMMFGCTGLALSHSSILGAFWTIVLGAAAGLFAMWLIAKGFSLMRSLQSTGTMRIYDAIGEEGTVYLRIPADGIGKVQVTVSGRLTVMDAVSQDNVELKTEDRVCVAEITSDGMLSVRKI